MSSWSVPQYTVHAFKPRQTRYCICVFVLNEGQRIQQQLGRMRFVETMGDIIVADGGSTDHSLEHEFLQGAGVRALLVKTGPGRLSAQMRMAFAYCLNQGYEGIVVMDGNGKDGVEAIPLFFAVLNNHIDHAQGSRYIPGGKAVNTPFLRHWGVRLIHSPLISLASRRYWTDTTNGFRAYSRAFLLDPRVQPFRDIFVNYELHYYLAIRAARLGFRTQEIPVTRAYPQGEKTPTKITGWKGNSLVLKNLFSACIGRYDP